MSDHARYRLTLAGMLGPRCTSLFEAFALEQTLDGCTLLEGNVPDQAALHGVLRRIRDLGMVLLSLERLDQGTD